MLGRAVLEPAAALPPRTTWGVAALLLATGDALQSRFGALTVKGELSGWSRAASGHCYFSLKDLDGAPALLRCAMFRRAAAMLGFDARDGQQVEVRGRLGVYEARGELQFIVESMQRLGAGSLYEEFLRLKARLQALGLFDAARKRPIERHPRAIGIVTSTGAAALQDVLSTLARRAPQVAVVIYPSLVQGADAPVALAAALLLAGQRAEVDTLLLVRGGGSLEDLWAFNDERVVQAVADCPLPVVCGVGHETDITLADLAADLRAPTPTAAAELAAPARQELRSQLDALGQTLVRRVRRGLDARAQALDTLALRLGGPARGLRVQQQWLRSLAQRQMLAAHQVLAAAQRAQDGWAQRLGPAVQRALQQRHFALQAQGQRLDALNPHKVLSRGYARVTGDDGRALVSSTQVQPGDRITATWSDGSARAEVLAPTGTAKKNKP